MLFFTKIKAMPKPRGWVLFSITFIAADVNFRIQNRFSLANSCGFADVNFGIQNRFSLANSRGFADVNFGIQNRFSLANSCGLANHHTLNARTFLNYMKPVNEFNSVCSQRYLFSNHEGTL